MANPNLFGGQHAPHLPPWYGPQNNAHNNLGGAAPPAHPGHGALWQQMQAVQQQAYLNVHRPPKRPRSPTVSDTSSRPPSPTSLLGSETAISDLMVQAPEDAPGPVTRHADLFYETLVFRVSIVLNLFAIASMRNIDGRVPI